MAPADSLPVSAPAAPKVFISYSHDSEEHRTWVRELAADLRRDGINVILDQWHLRRGANITAFMEDHLQSSDRVLIICTDQYVKKIETVKGGVRYERMIVTAEIAKDLATTKFIPILKSVTKDDLPPFLAALFYVDLNSPASREQQYEELLRELHDLPLYTAPPIGKHHLLQGGARSGGSTAAANRGHAGEAFLQTEASLNKEEEAAGQSEEHHWHGSLHRYCGNTLRIVLLRFSKDSIIFRDSILDDIITSGISDYLVLHLYSQWDILIRLWADDETFTGFKNLLDENKEVHRVKEFLTVSNLTLLRPDYREEADILPYIKKVNIDHLEDVQQFKRNSVYFQEFLDQGLLLEDTIRFHRKRIQFYITVKSTRELHDHWIVSLSALVEKWTRIENKSIYKTNGSAIRLIVKGQVEYNNYYSIYDLLREIAKHLEHADAETETLFVAHPDARRSTTINFKEAKWLIARRYLQQLHRSRSQLDGWEWQKVGGQYADIWDKLPDDRYRVFPELFEAKITKSAEKMANHVSFFTLLEKLLQRKLPHVLMKEYQNQNWQATLDELKQREGGIQNNYSHMTLGELGKIYRRIVLEKAPIQFAPLTETAFAKLMTEDLPNTRNKLGHRPDLEEQWDAVFGFWKEYIEIYTRMRGWLESVV